MKCTMIIDPEHEEEVLIYAHEKTRLISEIEELVSSYATEMIGYCNNSIAKLNPCDIHCFTVEDNKIFALTETERWQIKQRLYQLETILGSGFVKINQSCIVSIKNIERFDVSIGGSLMVTLKNGYRDYVSRRQLKIVKERLGFHL